MTQIDSEREITLLDGVSLVMGSAIASIHVLWVMRSGLSIFGWVMICLAFLWVAVTATGPFIFLARRFSQKFPGYPRVGDWLWAVLGMPWLITAVIRSAIGGKDHHSPLPGLTLGIGQAIVCFIAVVVVWKTWVAVPPERAADLESTPWTSRVGLILAIAWPIQCGLGMVVLN
jgi:hypothetical protein